MCPMLIDGIEDFPSEPQIVIPRRTECEIIAHSRDLLLRRRDATSHAHPRSSDIGRNRPRIVFNLWTHVPDIGNSFEGAPAGLDDPVIDPTDARVWGR